MTERRQLGQSDLQVPHLCFGGNIFGWTVNQEKSFELLDAWLGEGLNFIDTADIYSRWAPGNQGGESETILGNWMKKRGNRASILVATKVGMEMAPDKKGLKKAYIFKAVEDSLKRLQTDHIDLYQSHQDDLSTPIEETLQAYQELIKQGKVRFIGASNYTGPRLQEALDLARAKGLPRYESLQPQYNMYERQEFEKNLEPVCAKDHLGVISYFSLASGFLSGKYRSAADAGKSARGSGIVQKYLNERGMRILQALDLVSEKHRANPTQVSLAWLIHRPSMTAPIVSATSTDQIRDLVAATRLKLSADDVSLLNKASE